MEPMTPASFAAESKLLLMRYLNAADGCDGADPNALGDPNLLTALVNYYVAREGDPRNEQ
jgi:hypothetical protein